MSSACLDRSVAAALGIPNRLPGAVPEIKLGCCVEDSEASSREQIPWAGCADAPGPEGDKSRRPKRRSDGPLCLRAGLEGPRCRYKRSDLRTMLSRVLVNRGRSRDGREARQSIKGKSPP